MITDSQVPIPLDAGKVGGWKSITIEESAEALIPIGAFSEVAPALLTSSVYYGEHSSSPYSGKRQLKGSLISVFVRESVAKRLLEAQRLLPDGCRLLVFDAYRPLKVQDSLFRLYRGQLRMQRPDMSEEELDNATQTYVSIPSSDPSRPSPHNTGGAVDLVIVTLPSKHSALLDRIDDRLKNERLSITDRSMLEQQKSAIVRRHAKMLNFGTPFDHGGERAAIAYFERKSAHGESLSPNEIEARDNRRLLYNVMSRAGMQAYEAEWWHFNAPESQMGAAAAGLDKALYGGGVLKAPDIAHEEFRRKLYNDMIALGGAADPRLVTSHWPIEVIEPESD